MQDWQVYMRNEWEKLHDEQKSSYMTRSGKSFEEYKREIQIWEEKMIRLGNIDVVRNEALIQPKRQGTNVSQRSRGTEEQELKCPGPDTLSSCSAVDGDLQRDGANVPSQETGKLVGQDTDATELSIFKENQATKPRASSCEVVNTENVGRTGSNVKEKFRNTILDATDKSKTVQNKLSGEWTNIKSKFPDGYRWHVVILSGVIVCMVCCLRFIL